MKTPEEDVIQKVVDDLVTSKLLTPDSVDKVKKKISSGSMTSEDWRLTFEMDDSKASDSDEGEEALS